MIRKDFLKYVVLGFSVIYNIANGDNLEKVTLEDAKKNFRLRQQYIDRIVDELYNENDYKNYQNFINSVNYSLLLSKPVFTEFSPRDIGKKIKVNIHVSGLLFEDKSITGDEEMKSVLGDHELFHVKDIFYGINLDNIKIDYSTIDNIAEETFVSLVELRAFQNQLNAILNNKRTVNQKFHINLAIKYLEYFKKLRIISKKIDINGRIAKKQLDNLVLIPERKGNGIEIRVK